jgi:hypothetical protein
MFTYEAPHVINEKGKVMDILSGKDTEGNHISTGVKNDKISQQWDIIYVSEWDGEPGKGELNPDFNLYVQRPFYIISELSSNRYLDLINNRNMVIKTRNGRNTQVWWFDQVSLTIKTKLNNQSFDIPSSGKAATMQIYSTNSNWW